MKTCFRFAMILVLAAAPLCAEPSKQAQRLLKPGQAYLEEYLWQKRLAVVYKHEKGVGIVVAPKNEEEAARLEPELFDGVFYVALRDKNIQKAIAVDNGRVSGVKDLLETHCVQAAKAVSEETGDEIKKAFRTKHRIYFHSFVIPQKSVFRAFIIL